MTLNSITTMSKTAKHVIIFHFFYFRIPCERITPSPVSVLLRESTASPASLPPPIISPLPPPVTVPITPPVTAPILRPVTTPLPPPLTVPLPQVTAPLLPRNGTSRQRNGMRQRTATTSASQCKYYND